MANISTYPLGTPKSTDMLAGTAVNVEQADGTKVNLTRNFTVSSVAAFADATAAYTTFVATFNQAASATAPVFDNILQNTTGKTWTWVYNSTGQVQLTPDTTFDVSKLYVNVSQWGGTTTSPASTGNAQLSYKSTGAGNHISIRNLDSADGTAVNGISNGFVEVRLYS
tara:strand:- start:1582 stop:2085 length:504 start_codon:yes stop_codon:yes gene_type:complete